MKSAPLLLTIPLLLSACAVGAPSQQNPTKLAADSPLLNAAQTQAAAYPTPALETQVAHYLTQIEDLEKKQNDTLASFGFQEAVSFKTEFVSNLSIMVQPDSGYDIPRIQQEIGEMDAFIKQEMLKEGHVLTPSDTKIIIAIAKNGFCLNPDDNGLFYNYEYLVKKNFVAKTDCNEPGTTYSFLDPESKKMHNNRFLILIGPDVDSNCPECKGDSKYIMSYRQNKNIILTREQLRESTTFHEYFSAIMRLYNIKIAPDGYTDEYYVSGMELKYMQSKYGLANIMRKVVEVAKRNDQTIQGRPFSFTQGISHPKSQSLGRQRFQYQSGKLL